VAEVDVPTARGRGTRRDEDELAREEEPSSRVTFTVFASTISPRPWMISTPEPSSRCSMWSCSSIWTSVRRAMKRCIEMPFGTWLS